jgi:drug/metabolite transporter (DMT)-like permease
MSVPAAFMGVILIWSTTPLAIKWSGQGGGFLFGVSARMLLGMLCCLALMGLLSVPMPRDRRALTTYLIAGLGMFGSMLATYWGAQFIPSGLVSVLFGLTPVVTGVLAAQWLGERLFTPGRIGGALLGLGGLMLLFNDELGALGQGRWGAAAVVFAVVLHSASAVGVKRIGADVPAMAMAGGGLAVAVPLYLLTWWLADASLPQTLPTRTLGSIVYLGVVGSVIGFVLFYYVLKRLEASSIALVTLVTPVLALMLGDWLAGEHVSPRVWMASAVILSGLAMHQWADRWLLRAPVQ